VFGVLSRTLSLVVVRDRQLSELSLTRALQQKKNEALTPISVIDRKLVSAGGVTIPSWSGC
jgi:hypothetical protein